MSTITVRDVPKFLNQTVAEIAVHHGFSFMFNTSLSTYAKRLAGHVVILVPSKPLSREGSETPRRPFMLYDKGLNSETWEYDYAAIARSKAYQLWHGQNDGGTDIQPHQLFEGDAPFWGGVKREGIVVAFSGIQPHLDRMVAGIVADLCIGLAYEMWERSKDKKNDVCFLTHEPVDSDSDHA